MYIASKMFTIFLLKVDWKGGRVVRLKIPCRRVILCYIGKKELVNGTRRLPTTILRTALGDCLLLLNGRDNDYERKV